MKLLQLLLANPDRSYYVRELARVVGVQLNAIRREIANLEKVGLIGPAKASPDDYNQTDRCKYYRLLTDSLLYPELKELLIKVTIIEEREFVEELKRRAGKIKYLLLTGYFTEDKKAESDLLIVGELKHAVVAKIVHEFEKGINRELRYTIMGEQEYRDRREVGDKFLYGLLEAKHIVAVDEYQNAK
jgi:predicted transcriptional regulator